jgi:hypothetical protein
VTSCDREKKTDAAIVLEEYSRQNISLLDNKLTSDTTVYKYKGGEYRVVSEKFPMALSLYYVKGFYLDNPSPYGTYFHFDHTGKMVRYLFLCGDEKRNTYQLDFSSKSDKYQEQGDAFVDFYAPKIVNNTSNSYTLLFSTFPRKEIEAFYSIDKKNYQKLDIQSPGFDPFTKEAEIKLSKEQMEGGIALKIKAKNLWFPLLGLQDEKETTDTLFLSK